MHRNELYGNNRGRVQRLNPLAVQPQPPMIGNQPVRIRGISRQIDRDARDAMQRALDRYKLQEEEAGIPPDPPEKNAGQPVFELVHIPLTDPVDENNEQDGQLSRRNGDPQRQARDHQDGRDNNRNNNGQINMKINLPTDIDIKLSIDRYRWIVSSLSCMCELVRVHIYVYIVTCMDQSLNTMIGTQIGVRLEMLNLYCTISSLPHHCSVVSLANSMITEENAAHS